MESPVLAVGSSPRPLGEDSFHMWGLNRRLEAYLARVKSLEEENGLLRAEIERLRAEPAEPSWRGCCEEGVAALRARLDTAFQEKHRAELARDGLREEAQQVRARCQRARAAQEEARGLLSAGRRALEEEQRTQGWLRDRAARLETELEELLAAHEEERAGLDRERAAGCAWSLENGRAAPAAALQAPEVADYAQRLAGIWQGAVETYTAEVARLESALGQARAELGQVSEGGRQSQLQLQQLKTELAGLKVRKERLEESLARQWQLRQGDAEKLQVGGGRARASRQAQRQSTSKQFLGGANLDAGSRDLRVGGCRRRPARMCGSRRATGFPGGGSLEGGHCLPPPPPHGLPRLLSPESGPGGG